MHVMLMMLGESILLDLCGALQRALAPELDKLQRTIDQTSASGQVSSGTTNGKSNGAISPSTSGSGLASAGDGSQPGGGPLPTLTVTF